MRVFESPAGEEGEMHVEGCFRPLCLSCCVGGGALLGRLYG